MMGVASMSLAKHQAPRSASLDRRMFWHGHGLTVLGVLLAATSPARADTANLAPLKDNTLYADTTGALSNGAGSAIFVGRTGNGDIRRAVIAFDVAGALLPGSLVTSAT